MNYSVHSLYIVLKCIPVFSSIFKFVELIVMEGRIKFLTIQNERMFEIFFFAMVEIEMTVSK
jgi:hypothetical protein